MRACGAGVWRRARWLCALLAWGALLALALPLWQPPPRPPAPPARLLLQSDPLASTLPPSSLPPQPATDSRVVSEDQLLLEAEQRMPSLPFTYWFKNRNEKNKFYKKKDCAPFPSIYDLEFHNTYWQSLHTAGNGTFHIYGAYLDVRKTSRIGPAVRILAVHDRVKPTLPTHCQLWFEERAAPVIVRNLEYKYVWNSKWGNHRDGLLQPYLLACVLPPDVRHMIPAAVSLVENPCDKAKNLLKVIYNPPKEVPRKEFAVCVKGLDFLYEDLSVRLVEWIELIRLLGADKIFFYELQVHPNITKVLKHYESLNQVTVTPVTLPGGQPNLPGLQHMYLKKKTTHKRQMELIPYNDCLYRHMYEYRWLVLLDIDEVIVPLKDPDWSSLMKRILPMSTPAVGKPPRSSYHASNLYYLDSLQHEHAWEDGIPRYMHMLQHIYRTNNFTKPGQYVKAFHETDYVLTLHNHFPLACLGGACSSYSIPTEEARLQHYRADCVSALSKTCAELRANPVRDTAIWRWRSALIDRAEATLRALGFLPPHR